MKTAGMVVVVLVLQISSGHAQDSKADLGGLVKADPLPANYQLHRLDDVVQDGKTVAERLLVAKNDSPSKVSISIDKIKRETDAQRRAAFKGYVNGTAQLFASAGLKLVDKKIPDVTKADFGKRQTVDLVYQQADGNDLFVQLQVFFADDGYNIVVMGSTQEELNTLAKWARSIQAE